MIEAPSPSHFDILIDTVSIHYVVRGVIGKKQFRLRSRLLSQPFWTSTRRVPSFYTSHIALPLPAMSSPNDFGIPYNLFIPQ